MRALTATESLLLGLRFLFVANRINRMPYFSTDRIREYQLSRLQKLVRFAYKNVPFYRRKYDEAGMRPEDIRSFSDFKRLPTVTKQEVILNYPHDIIARGTDLNSCVISKSSGSSGSVLNVVYTANALITYVLAGFRVFTMIMDYRPWHKQVYIYTSPYPMNNVLGAYRLYFIPTVNDIGDTVEKLKQIKPDLLVCYPSHLRQLSQNLSKSGKAYIKPHAISVNSEMSTQRERDELSEFFGCGVYDEYSTEELTRVAAQCKSKNYHVFEDINYIEVLDEDGNDAAEGQVGEIVGTNLHNFCMPFIRYRQSDLGSLETKTCPCGRNFRLLKELKGRKNDQFILPDGKILSSGFMLDASYGLILEFEDAILDFCIVQEKRNVIVVEVIPGGKYTKEMGRKMEERFKEMIKADVDIKVRPVEKLYKTISGKQNPIISKV